MPLQDDQSIPGHALLFRVLVRPEWITTEGNSRRPSSAAFYSSRGEVSYFVEGPNVLDEINRVHRGLPIAQVPAATIREVGLAIERRPNETDPEMQCDANAHVVAGPPNEIGPKEFQKRARQIAKHSTVSIIDPDPPAPVEAAGNEPNA